VIVVDSSVVANAIAVPQAKGDAARERLARDPDIHAPQLMDLEVVSSVRRLSSHGEIEEEEANLALLHLRTFPAVRYPHVELIPRIWELRNNATPYDASYIALAEELDCPLVTADAHLVGVPSIRCHVEVLR